MTEPIKDTHIAVIGAGVMGSGIAQKYASSGYSVTIIDTQMQSLQKSQAGIDAMLEQGVVRGVFKPADKAAIMGRITFSNQLLAAQHADVVVEAIFEDKTAKIELFRHIEEICSPQTLLATNTSSLKVADMQVALRHKDRFLGLHYFFHPAKNRLVELIGTEMTSADALIKAQKLQETINKVVIHSKDSPGFIVNRFFVPWLNEAVKIVHESVATIATVEEAAKRVFKIGMGPFTLMNVTGLPITYHASTAMAEYLGPFYAPCPLIAEQLSSAQQWDVTGNVEETKIHGIGMRLMAVITAISHHMVFDEHVCGMADADVGARVGLLWEKGPFELFYEHKNELAVMIEQLELPTKLKRAYYISRG